MGRLQQARRNAHLLDLHRRRDAPAPYIGVDRMLVRIDHPAGGKFQYLPRWLKVSLDSALTTTSTNS